jgi:hypothetical protein
MPTPPAEIALKPRRAVLRAALVRAVAMLPPGVPGGAARTLAARWLVLRDTALLLAEREERARALPLPPANIRSYVSGCASTEIGVAPDALLSTDPLAFHLGVCVQELLQWTISPDGSPKPIGRAERRAAGSFYTPRPLVDRVVGLALNALGSDRAAAPLSICDPACGSGNFLSGVSMAIKGAKGEPSLHGADLDPLAAWAAEAGLHIRRGEAGIDPQIRHGDALVGSIPGVPHDCVLADATGTIPLSWPARFDLVIGNPPFLGQLTAATSRSRALAAYIRDASKGVISGYADTAAAFLWRSIMLCAPNGVVAMIVPRSILAARDATSLRQFIDAHAEVVHLEPIDRAMFDAGVHPCIIIVRRRADPAQAADGRPAAAWSFGATPGGEAETPKPTTSLGMICAATADFRDAYYGLRDFIFEDEGGTHDERRYPRLITSGMIEPGRTLWGQKRFRLLKTQWLRPRVDLHRMRSDPSMLAWATKRLVPKILVATQTRAIECVADERGEWLPVTPVITIVPHSGVALSRVMNALLDPAASDAAARMAEGTGMSAGVFRLTARQIGQLPLNE